MTHRPSSDRSITPETLLSRLSHEIRTPLNGVLGATALLQDSDLDHDQQRYVRIIKSGADTLLSLVNDILDHARMTSGRLEIDNVDFNLRAAVDDICTMMTMVAHGKDIDLVTDIDPRLPDLVRGDPGRIRQVLTNLIGNAVKFTHQGRVSISVQVTDDTPAGLTVTFTIADTGIGIAPEKLGSLFDPFVQAGPDIARQYGGTGLGLSIADQLITAMGGRIRAASTPAKGSEFSFSITLEKPATRCRITEDADAVVANDLRVLVVDANRFSRRTLVRQLKQMKIASESVEDLQQAQASMRQTSNGAAAFDVLILVCQHDPKPIIAFARSVRRTWPIQPPGLVLITSMGVRGDAAQYQKAGFSAYLTGPVNTDMLADCLHQIAGRKVAVEQPKVFITRYDLDIGAGQPPRILVVDDDDVNRQLARQSLSASSFRVATAINGRRAIAAVQRQAYDLILLDVQMPEMDGLTVAEAIRRLDRPINHVPIIAMTASAGAQAAQECIQAGMDDVLVKPVAARLLTDKIDFWIDGARSEAEWHRDEPPMNVASALTRAVGNVKLLRRLLDRFCLELTGHLSDLGTAVGQMDLGAAAAASHIIAGAAANLSAAVLSRAASAMETAARRQQPESMRHLLRQMQIEAYRLIRFARVIHWDTVSAPPCDHAD